MKNLLVFASAIMIGTAAIAGTVPRVYQYQAKLYTAVAKNASKVTYRDSFGDKEVELDVCYRKKGKVTFKGAVLFSCDCVDENADLADGYPMVLLTSSEDKYKTLYVYLNGNMSEWGFGDDSVWAYNRIGSALSSKAKIAELGFSTWFATGGDPESNDCFRVWDLWHAGFGKSKIIDSGDGTLDLYSVKGNVVGWVLAPYCSAVDNNCPRCTETGDCEFAIGFAPCEFEDPFEVEQDPDDGGIAYGSFSLKYSKSYSGAIKGILEDNLTGTIEALRAKAFKKADQLAIFDSDML